MLDLYMRRQIDPFLEKTGRFIAEKGLHANTITLTGFFFGVCAFIALIFPSYGYALFFLCLNRIMDGLDGAVARSQKGGATDLGAFLDIVTDFIFYAGFIFFFVVGRPENALVGALLIFSFMGTSSSFLAYAIIAAKRKSAPAQNKKKSFYYLGGLTEGSETIMAFILMCLLPAYFTTIAVIFSSMCWLTTIGRIKQAFSDFS